MSDNIQWMLELDVSADQLDAAKSLMEEMVTATQADEPGALAYEWFISADKSSVHIYERYADSAAVMTHMGNFGAKFAERFLSIFKPTRLYVYGSPSQEVIDTLAGLGPVHLAQIGGFAR